MDLRHQCAEGIIAKEVHLQCVATSLHVIQLLSVSWKEIQ